MFFRFATLSDAKKLRTLSEDTFRHAYAAFNTQEDMETYCAKHFSLAQIEKEIEDAQTKFILALEDDEILGYVKLNHAPELTTGTRKPLELARLYTRVDLIGKGTGRQLVDEAVRYAQENDFDALCLSVWQKNPKAIKFYEREKFVIAGTTQFLLGNDLQDDFVMVRTIAAG